MMLRTLVTAFAVLWGCSVSLAEQAAPTVPKAISLLRVAPGRVIEIKTDARVYQCQLIRPLTGETLARVSQDGGRTFGKAERLYILGATAGRPAGEMLLTRGHQIQRGLRMEMGRGSRRRQDRAISEIVRSFRVQ